MEQVPPPGMRGRFRAPVYNDPAEPTSADDVDMIYGRAAQSELSSQAGPVHSTDSREDPEQELSRPRGSALAIFGLLLALVAVMLVGTGVLATLGLIVGVLTVPIVIGGLVATSRYDDLTGRAVAIVGLLLATAAIVVAVLAITGRMPILDTETNQVERLREWLPDWPS